MILFSQLRLFFIDANDLPGVIVTVVLYVQDERQRVTSMRIVAVRHA